MEKNVVFNSGESVCFRAAVFQRKGWFQRVSGIVWLTQERLLLLECYAFARDSILEIPRGCVVRVECEPGSERRRVKMTYSDSSGEGVLDLQAAFPALNNDGGQLSDALEHFKSGTFEVQG
jgi:hypothetical protein